MNLPFLKMHGLGNDFIVIDDLGKPEGLQYPITPELARKLCDRRFGIGCDQLLWMKAPRDGKCDARMDIFNPDGSVAEMCGNGIRAAAIFLSRHGSQPGQPRYSIETLAGVMHVEFAEGGVAVDMGEARLGESARTKKPEPIEALGQRFEFIEVSMGNPHAVIFVKDVSRVPLETAGPALERHPRFPDRTNVEFTEVKGPSEISVRVWERGAGATLACGTGACAAAVAAISQGLVQSPVRVHLPGGTLTIAWPWGDRGTVRMEGPAEEVFRGEFPLT